MEAPGILNERGLSEDGYSPMVALESEALLMSGLTRERAFAIDNLSIGKQVEEFAFNRLIDAFYVRLLADKDEEFR